MFQILKAARPDIPNRALTVIETELISLLSEKIPEPGGLLEMTIPIYGKHFTHAEIRELLAFYETPIGKKAVRVLPEALSEGMITGQQWGKKLGPEINERN